MTRRLTRADREDIAAIVRLHRANPTLPAQVLLGRLPMSRRRALSIFRRLGAELGEALGFPVRYYPSRYDATGNGPFGRYGSKRGGYVRAGVEFCMDEGSNR